MPKEGAGKRAGANIKMPPMRKNTPPLLSERTVKRGEHEYVRRDYEDGTVELVAFDKSRRLWVYEIYEFSDVPEMNYPFEECLLSPVFFARYLSRIYVLPVD